MFIDFKLSVEKKKNRKGNLTGGKFGPHIIVESAKGWSVGNDLTVSFLGHLGLLIKDCVLLFAMYEWCFSKARYLDH